jgi:hypothetical protein
MNAEVPFHISRAKQHKVKTESRAVLCLLDWVRLQNLRFHTQTYAVPSTV